MKKHKLISFSAFNKKESLWQEIVKGSPLQSSIRAKISDLLAEPGILAFLTIKLKVASRDTIDLVCYLLSQVEIPSGFSLAEYQSSAPEYYIQNRIYELSQRLGQPGDKPKTSKSTVYNEDIKRTSLLEMLTISAGGDIATASLVSELMEAPLDQVLDMIDYIANFEDKRVFNLLRFFVVSDEKKIIKTTIAHLGFLVEERVFGFLLDLLAATEADPDIIDEINRALQKQVCSQKLDENLINNALE